MNKRKEPKLPGPKARCGACNGTGEVQCRRCWGALTFKDWRGRVFTCGGCGGTGTQACIVCKQMGVRD